MCRQLLTEQKWLDTILPRIPIKIGNLLDFFFFFFLFIYLNYIL